MRSGFSLGYHGCDEQVGERILAGKEPVKISENAHDWLGAGAYFWENDPLRALNWAEHVQRHPQHFQQKVTKPFVVGAIIESGFCLDLTDSWSLEQVHEAYLKFAETCANASLSLPVDEPGFRGDLDLVKRHLDCAVINFVHVVRDGHGLAPFDTVRGAFSEGKPLYKGGRIMEQTHVQICVRHPRRSIRGYFRPLPGG